MSGPVAPLPGEHAMVADVRRACARLESARMGLVARPWREIAGHLGKVGARFLEPSDPLRTEALSRLPDEAGLSPEMAEAVLDRLTQGPMTNSSSQLRTT